LDSLGLVNRFLKFTFLQRKPFLGVENIIIANEWKLKALKQDSHFIVAIK
jgi:hypothetical protein